MLQGTLFKPDSSWRPLSLSDLPDWRDVTRIGLDCETRDEQLRKIGPGVRRKDSYIVGVSFALGDNRRYYLPFRHLGGDNLDEAAVLKYLRYQAANFNGEVVGANLQYDIDFMAQDGIVFKNVKRFLDVQVAEPLLDELQNSYSLNRIADTWGEGSKDEELLTRAMTDYGIPKKDHKKYMWKMPARYIGPYAEEDAALPLRILAKQEVELKRQNLTEVWELESDCLPVLVKMRRRGVKVDFDRLEKIERWAIAEETKALGELHRHTGVRVNQGDTMKVNRVAPALQAVGIILPRTAKGAPSITKDIMAAIEHPAADILRRARQMSQLRTTFVNSIRSHSVNGRIHCTFNQLRKQKDDGSGTQGAAYGRLSSSDPNLQQQPARDPEIGPMWRSIYRADEGGLWAQLDYSQQEPRMLLHFAVLAGQAQYKNKRMISKAAYEMALKAQAMFVNDPKTDNHAMFTRLVYGDAAVNAMSKIEFKQARDRCKNIFLGICYGMGGPKLCREVGLPTDIISHRRTGRRYEVAGKEGQALFDKVDTNVPYVRAMAKSTEIIVKDRGYITTLSGRRCRFPVDQYNNYDWTHKALNRLIQGSSADQTKRAMVDMDAAGIPLQLQVHDEFDFTAESEAQANLGAEIMTNAYDLCVPSTVDVGLGPSWGEVVE